jgi:hypothetical protein
MMFGLSGFSRCLPAGGLHLKLRAILAGIL